MEIQYVDDSLLDIKFWKKSDNKVIQKKIEQLILAILEDPFRWNRKTRSAKI
ncbi:hypothetical protein GCM10011413_36930 [Pedobacter psychrotolerans]|uniref:Toxin YoeB n=1 Tax=Pedobacter psychrotolerans TaxID=1843235 RepID=A0ABQ1SX98_9SPHI|nr:hypothetical protein GCM10011413_36930 [Pedobacter psychrotolerans]